jgi:hypothetical protein
MAFRLILVFLGYDKAQRRLLRSTAKRRLATENEDEAQARNLVIASAGEAIQPWSESRIASSLPLLAMTSGGIQRVAHSADWRSVIR